MADKSADKSGRETLVKICGLRRPEDAVAANAAGPDLAGFILSPGFRRSIALEQAQELRGILSDSIRTVGVFVNAPREDILRAARSGCIDMVQLHGDEDDAEIRAVQAQTGLPVIKAYRIGGRQDLEAAAASAAQWVLLDSGTGTGRTFDWELLAAFLDEKEASAGQQGKPIPPARTAPDPVHDVHEGHDRPEAVRTQLQRDPLFSGEDGRGPAQRLFPGGHAWMLAGGLSAENVADAVRRFHPTAVDVSSRVETDGWKDPAKMLAFTRALR